MARSKLLHLACLIWLIPAQAGIHKWVDEDGNTHFTDNPPRQVESEQIFVRANTYSSPEIIPDSTSSDSVKSSAKVIMYSAEWCGVCKKARRYFNANQISFSEYDVEKSAKGRKDYKKLNGKGVPIILINKHRMNGFSASSFQSMYQP